MVVYFDTSDDAFVVHPDECPECEEPFYQSGCTAPGCNGLACQDCGTGCDLDFDDEGRCATALDNESDEEYDERINAERAAFGLPKVAG